MRVDDFAVVISSVDRQPNGNYLRATIANLSRAGLFTSSRLHSCHIIDSGAVTEAAAVLGAWPDRALADLADLAPQAPIRMVRTPTRRSAKQTCAAALWTGAYSGADWVLHLEDDLDVCADFLGSIGRWLDRYGTPDYPLFSFNANHSAVEHALAAGRAAWNYDIAWFWGFQCFAVRPAVAISLAEWFEAHPLFIHADGRPDENAHDLEIHRWAMDRDVRWFRGSAPSFVQHIGAVSSIPGNSGGCGGAAVRFPSWPGPTWVYSGTEQEQEMRLC